MSKRRPFTLDSLRVLKDAVKDRGFREIRPRQDLQLLVAFLERFDALGWIPPVTREKRRLLAAHDVIIHLVRDGLCFYEFCAKGGRGERNPWLTIFFHVDDGSRQVRICGVELTAEFEKRRSAVLKRMSYRAELIDESLRRAERGNG